MSDIMPKLIKVIPNNDYTLTLFYDNGEKRLLDISRYLDKGIFKELKNIAKFRAVKIVDNTVQWETGQDLCPDTIYVQSILYEHDPTCNSKKLFYKINA